MYEKTDNCNGYIVCSVVVLGSILGVIFGIKYLKTSEVPTSNKVVIHLDFSHEIVEQHPTDPFQRLTSRGTVTLLDMIRILDNAATDPKVTGVVADLSSISMGLAQLQEIRSAVERFRASGKWSIAYADTFFSSKTGTGVYYMASVFDEIYMHPTGDVGFLGLAIEPIFCQECAGQTWRNSLHGSTLRV